MLFWDDAPAAEERKHKIDLPVSAYNVRQRTNTQPVRHANLRSCADFSAVELQYFAVHISADPHDLTDF